MEVKFILNIGLNIVDATAPIAAHVARQILAANDFLIVRDTVLQSDTEPTLVAEVISLNSNPLVILQLLHAVAEELEQDCIAVHRPKTGGGALIGPRASKWGKFNPEFFFNLDGTRLAQPVQQAA